MSKQEKRQENLTLIRITKKTQERIKILAFEKGFKQVTTLEYLLNGKIPLKELKATGDKTP